jgi:hypothetical protein
MRLALILVASVGCCPVAIEGVVGEEVEPPAGAEEAIELIHQEYMAAFDSPRREVSVTWVTSIELEGREKLGLAYACDDLWVVFGEKPSDTALSHEVAHCYAKHVPESGCLMDSPGHPESWVWGSGGLVSVTKQVLRDASI